MSKAIKITKASTISAQPSFGKSGFHASMKVLEEGAELIHPQYKEFIPVMSLRRMTDVIKMSVACGKDCVGDNSDKSLDAIIVGTAHGSLNHTSQFMEKVEKWNGGLLSPTSFMLSTHNTMAGQISLALNSNGYNITYVHNSLSFEQSLLDAMMQHEEGASKVLIGTADESNHSLFSTHKKLGSDQFPETCGASFFLTQTEDALSRVSFIDVFHAFKVKDLVASISQFLNQHHVDDFSKLRVYYSCYDRQNLSQLKVLFNDKQLIAYEQYSGAYLTSPSFAAHMAYDFLLDQKEACYALIVNNMLPDNVGLTLLSNT